jgi:molybdopterin/thiamine biosynthesis adenylyltransferase
MDYSRNWFFISSEIQEKIKNYPIFFGGCGLSSRIVEDLVRIGFEGQHTLVDHDKVSLSNLNRQNFIQEDIDRYKVNATYERLKNINPNVNLKIFKENITSSMPNEIKNFIESSNLVINCIDFNEEGDYHYLNRLALSFNKIVICPFNFSYHSFVRTYHPDKENYEEQSQIEMIKPLADYNSSMSYIEKYLKIPPNDIPNVPQLSMGVSLVSAHVCNLIVQYLNGKINSLPESSLIGLNL